MSSKYRRKRGYRRDHLFVIAAEGACTEVLYFNGIKRRLRNSRIKIEVLERNPENSGNSTWSDAVKMLDDTKIKKEYRANDEFFVVVDRDAMSNKPSAVRQAAAKCKQKGYQLIVSNPCVELWFLLHYRDIEDFSQDEQRDIYDNRNKYLRTLLRQIIGEYNHKNIKMDHFFPLTQVAIERAQKLDQNVNQPWPDQVGSRLYILLSKLLVLDSE